MYVSDNVKTVLSRLIIVLDSVCRAIHSTFHVKYISFSDNLPFYVAVMNDNERTDSPLMIEHNIKQRRILSGLIIVQKIFVEKFKTRFMKSTFLYD
jgi:hypothetical protein